MAQQSTIEVGNAIIALNSPNDPFCDGHTTGYLEFYDERHRPSFPLTTQAIADYLLWASLHQLMVLYQEEIP
jgi:hypothetical protein